MFRKILWANQQPQDQLVYSPNFAGIPKKPNDEWMNGTKRRKQQMIKKTVWKFNYDCTARKSLRNPRRLAIFETFSNCRRDSIEITRNKIEY